MPYLFPTLIASGITKSFRTGAPALHPLDLKIAPGEVHVVVGRSGAGKTTLAEIIGGLAKPNRGSVHLQGQLTTFRDRGDAESKGVRLVGHNLAVSLRETVCDFLQLGVVPKKFGFTDNHALHLLTRSQLQMVGIEDIDPAVKVNDLSSGHRKRLQIATAISKPTLLLVLDDPCAWLTAAEVDWLEAQVRHQVSSGAAVLWLTSSAEEALRFGDQISILREGHLNATHDREGLFIHQILGEMLGRDPFVPVPRRRIVGPEIGVRVESLGVNSQIVAFSVKAKRAEIIGILGLEGAGQSEAIQVVAGVRPKIDGAVYLKGSAIPAHIGSREQAQASGIGFVPCAVGAEPAPHGNRVSLVAKQGLRALSADNPHRAVLLHCLEANCSTIVLDEPTRGLNIACQFEMREAMLDLAEGGITVLVASTDADDLVTYCDRICLMVNGRIVRTVDRKEFDANKLRGFLKNPR